MIFLLGWRVETSRPSHLLMCLFHMKVLSRGIAQLRMSSTFILGVSRWSSCIFLLLMLYYYLEEGSEGSVRVLWSYFQKFLSYVWFAYEMLKNLTSPLIGLTRVYSRAYCRAHGFLLVLFHLGISGYLHPQRELPMLCDSPKGKSIWWGGVSMDTSTP